MPRLKHGLGQQVPALVLIALFVAVAVYLDALRFELEKDETHFWPTSLQFAESWLPSVETLRDYPELSTPLPFWIFG